MSDSGQDAMDSSRDADIVSVSSWKSLTAGLKIFMKHLAILNIFNKMLKNYEVRIKSMFINQIIHLPLKSIC